MENKIKNIVVQAIYHLYQKEIDANRVQIKNIPKEHEGDYSIITFPFAKLLGQAPQKIAEDLGNYLKEQTNLVSDYSVVKGFCNLSIGDGFWLDFLKEVLANPTYGQQAAKNETVVVEYSSPNTNKPLHLGHVRNNLLGYATAEVLKAAGYDVKKVQIINDRGVHICKSMLAWKRYGNGETPESTGMKGDHLVGKYYVRFETEFQKEYVAWQQSEAAQELVQDWSAKEKDVTKVVKKLSKKDKATDETALTAYFFNEVYKNTYFNTYSILGKEAKKMLQDWEANDPEVRQLWETMNGWVYKGFEKTYERLGVDFDKLYYESKTYLEGKKMVETELEKENSLFFKKDDGSTWIDLKDAKLDEKVILRKDGTSMYITQDLGTANLRFQDYQMDSMVYVVANEQDYHFKVLFEILDLLGHPYAKKCHHLSYGMVNLTTGKMKSREGTVVDADDLMQSIYENVKVESQNRNTLNHLPKEVRCTLWENIALGALKFHLLSVNPTKEILFDPNEVIDFQGQTGVYVVNTYVKIQSIFRNLKGDLLPLENQTLLDGEKTILRELKNLPKVVDKAAKEMNPSLVANYMYDLAKEYQKYYNQTKIITPKGKTTSLRVNISLAVAKSLKWCGTLLGIEMVDYM